MTVRFLRDLPSSPVKSKFISPFLYLVFCHCFLSSIFPDAYRTYVLTVSLYFSIDSADSYKDGYKACLQRVSELLPKTSLDKDACQRVNDYIQQSMPAEAPCHNCCGQSSKMLPEIQQKIQNMKSAAKLSAETKSTSDVASPAIRAQPAQQSIHTSMWRPW